MLTAITPKTRSFSWPIRTIPPARSRRARKSSNSSNDVPDDVLLVMDEAYIEFLDDAGGFGSARSARGAKPNLLLMRTFSKIFGLAGLRLGYGIGNPELIAALEKIRQPFNINSIAQAAALAALDDAEHVRKTRANNSRGLEFFCRTLRAI